MLLFFFPVFLFIGKLSFNRGLAASKWEKVWGMLLPEVAFTNQLG